MSDDSVQRDDQHAGATRAEERDAPRMLPWLDDPQEELFRAAPRNSPES